MKKHFVPAVAICTLIGVAAPALALDKASPKCLPFMVTDPVSGIMFETFLPVATTAGTPEGFWMENGELGVSTTMGGTPDGFTEAECQALEIEQTANFTAGDAVEAQRMTAAERRERAVEIARERGVRPNRN